MFEIAAAVLIVCLVCFVFAATRILGVIALMILLLLYPVMIVAVVIIGGVAYYFHCQKKR